MIVEAGRGQGDFTTVRITPQLACVGPIGNIVPIGIGLIFRRGPTLIASTQANRRVNAHDRRRRTVESRLALERTERAAREAA